MRKLSLLMCLVVACFSSCNKDKQADPIVIDPGNLSVSSISVAGRTGDSVYYDVPVQPEIVIRLTAPVNRNSVESGLKLKLFNRETVPINIYIAPGDTTIVIKPVDSLQHLEVYHLIYDSQITTPGGVLQNPGTVGIHTSIDSSYKFALLTDEQLLDTIQLHSFNYFWRWSGGMAKESGGYIVTTGGTGFGIMSILAGVNRKFITRQQALDRVLLITDYLENKAPRYKGAFAHWMDETTGYVIPFSVKDDGADLVETAFLMQGLLSARQFFDGNDIKEVNVRAAITRLYNAVEWSNFVLEGANALYWHWSPTYNFEMNLPISGWNEALVTYVLAAGSPTYPISKAVYDNGWARNSAIKNNNSYYGVQLPLGEPFGGPMFFSHYSFLGLDPNGLVDQYANYGEQVRAHAKIQHKYAIENPLHYFGYSSAVWGLSASGDPGPVPYRSHSPTDDNGTISPTAAISSLPFTPEASMEAMRFYYYVLGDRLFDEFGFYSGFNLQKGGSAHGLLAIDQGPIVIMIENHRSKLLWNLFMNAPEVKKGLTDLGFSSPHF